MAARREDAEWLARVIQFRDEERARISRVLHDEIGQVLSAAGLHLDLLRMDCKAVAGVADRIAHAQGLLEQVVAQVRELSYALDPGIVGRLGLQGAVERLIARWRKSFPGSLRLSWGGARHLPGQAAEACYRIVELALENAVRHSGAGRIEVSLRPEGRGVCLEIRDNGSGFALERVRRQTTGLGLRLIEHQARRGGLQLSLASEPGKGTIVRAVFRPHARAASGASPEPRQPAI